MKKFCLFAALTGLLAVAGCNRIEQDGIPAGGKTIRLHITAQAPGITRTTLSEDLQFAWEGNESLGIIFGNSSSSNAETSAVVEIPSIAPGVFEGEITIPSGFTETDIQGVAYPADGSFFKYQSGQKRIVTTVPATQTQASEGKLNGKNTPVFAVWDALKWEVDENTYAPVDLTLDCASAILRLNIYGELAGMQSNEKVQSLEFVGNSTNLCGTAEYNTAGSNAGKFTYNGKGATMTLNLDEPAVLSGRTQTNPLVLYMGILGRGTGTNSSKEATITSFTIVTDKASYKYSPEGKKLSPAPGEGYVLGLNLAKFTRASKISYSADGGANWANEIPASFTTLAVKSSVALSEEDLRTIATAVKAQSGNVDLDLSQVTVERTDVNGTMVGLFPAVFGSETAEDAVANLHTIAFPSNVTAIAENAFYNCSALESIDLTKITAINGYAFCATGLVDLVVPATVTSLEGKYQFGYCWKLRTLYYDSPAHQGKGSSNTTHTFSCRNTSAVDELPDEYKAENLIPLTATFGPHAVIGNQDFDTNHKLVKMIFEGKPGVNGNSWVVRCRYLNEFDFSTVSDPVAPGANNTAAIGELTPENSRKIYVPAGCGEAYYAANTWKALVDNNHFVIVENTDSNIQYSTDGGTTWGDAIPTGSFTALAVKGTIFAANLDEIKTAVDAQSGVALDLSAAVYESITFPAVFGGTTEAGGGSADGAKIMAAGSPLTSIKFPSNVTAIAGAAFRACDKLTSVDLTGIETIGGNAFQAAGLTSLTVPSSVTTFENTSSYAFSYCPDLATIVWNSPATNNHVFSWRNAGSAAANVSTRPTEITIGPGANFATGQCFDTNHKLVKVTFTGNPASMGSAWIIRCTSLAIFDLTACTTAFPASSTTSNLTNVGENVAAGSRFILVPDGTKDAFAAKQPWKYLVENNGYVIKEASE